MDISLEQYQQLITKARDVLIKKTKTVDIVLEEIENAKQNPDLEKKAKEAADNFLINLVFFKEIHDEST